MQQNLDQDEISLAVRMEHIDLYLSHTYGRLLVCLRSLGTSETSISPDQLSISSLTERTNVTLSSTRSITAYKAEYSAKGSYMLG